MVSDLGGFFGTTLATENMKYGGEMWTGCRITG